MFTSLILSMLRHGLTSAGAVVVAKGVATASEVDAAVGAITTLAGLAWAAWDKWKRAG